MHFFKGFISFICKVLLQINEKKGKQNDGEMSVSENRNTTCPINLTSFTGSQRNASSNENHTLLLSVNFVKIEIENMA
jgi:hypothetical protein